MRWVFGILLALVVAAPAMALETDQFTVPPKPLPNIGPALDARATAALRDVVAAANLTHAHELEAAAKAKNDRDRKLHLDRAYAAVSQQGLADAFYDSFVGGGVPVCKTEAWVNDQTSYLQPMPVSRSVYGANPFERPFLLIELAATIHLHDQYVGVDKIGHFFQQGHEYFGRYLAARCDGASESKAVAAAVAGGVSQEHGFYGEAIIGVYSNGDLSANFAGLLFYRNLMEPMQVGPAQLSPMIVWNGDHLQLADRLQHELLQPFVTDHWNEALNPCHYVGYWRPFVRDRIAQRLDAWMKFNHSTPQIEAERLTHMTTFFGQNYGHSGWNEVITLVNAGTTDIVASR